MNKPYIRIIWALVVLAIVVGALAAVNAKQQKDAKDAIDSFQDCVAAGYPVMESYPEQCSVPGGKTFTKQY